MENHASLIKRILPKLQKKRTQSAEAISTVLKHDILIYFPSPNATHPFLMEWIKIFESEYLGNVVIIASDSTRKSYLFNKFKFHVGADEMVLRLSEKRMFVLTVEELKTLEPQILTYCNDLSDVPMRKIENSSNIISMCDKNELNVRESSSEAFISSVIFENVESISVLEQSISILRLILRKVNFKAAITSSPFIFCDYFFKIKDKYFMCFTPENRSENRASFYRRMLETSEIIYFPDFLEHETHVQISNEIKEKIEPLDKKMADNLLFLLRKSIYDHNYVRSFVNFDFKFVSEKIICLFNIFKKRTNQNIHIYFSNSTDLKIVFEIIKNRSELIDVNNLKESEEYSLKNRILKGTTIKIDLKFITELPKSSKYPLSYVLIFFDYYPVFYSGSKYILASSSQKELFNNLIFMDDKIEKEIKPILKRKRSDPSFKKSNDEKQSRNNCKSHNAESRSVTYKYTVLSNNFQEITKKCKVKDFIHNVEKQNDNIVISASCSIGKIITAFNIYNIINQPIVIPKTQYFHNSLFLLSNKVDIGTLTSLSTFVDPQSFLCHGFVAFHSKSIVYFCFTSKLNIRIDINQEDMESSIILRKVKASEGELAKNDLSLCLQVYFILKNHPKVFICDKNFDLKNKLNENLPLFEKYEFFESIPWRRVSINEVPFFKERFDIRVSIPTNQPVNIVDLANDFINQDIFNKENVSNVSIQDSEIKYNGEDVPESYDSIPLLPGAINKKTIQNQLIETVVNALSRFQLKLVYSDVQKQPLTNVSLQCIQKFFSTRNFDEVYALLSLISQKGRFLVNKIMQEDLRYIEQLDIISFCRALGSSLKFRFDKVNVYLKFNPSDASKVAFIRSATITPLSIKFKFESLAETNRVLRNFDIDKFMRINLREENGRKILNDYTRNQDYVFDYFRMVMSNGINIGTRKYFFLVMTTSQMKEHNSWFMTPYEVDGTIIGTDYIKTWLGDFHNIKCIGKYAVRVGQPLSSTMDTMEFPEFLEIPDIERNGYCFTDGVGLITFAHATKISNILGLVTTPSAFQIRFAGYKGVLVVHPFIDDNDKYMRWLKKTLGIEEEETEKQKMCRVVIKNNKTCGLTLEDLLKANNIIDVLENSSKNKLETNSNSTENKLSNQLETTIGLAENKPKEMKASIEIDLKAYEKHHGLILRGSMNKFQSNHRMLEIISVSKSTEVYLNRQIILILEGLGIPTQVFVDLQDVFILGVLDEMNRDFPAFIRKFVPFFSKNFISIDFTFFRKLVRPILLKISEDLSKKSRILVKDGRAAMGVTDELQILKENEIFLMYRREGYENSKFVVDYGSYVVPTCTAIIAKNPCSHPGDIRIVQCVDRKELHYLKEVMVFSQKGERPLYNKCSGSDLDGDIFLLIWNPLLIPKSLFKPYDYINATALSKDTVLLSDIVNFYIKHMRSYQLGLIATSFMAMADKYSVFDSRALRLSELFNKNIDFVKTGNLASIPEDLMPTEYPDFMERLPSYESKRALGLLYRRSVIEEIVAGCECRSCINKELMELPAWQSFILRGSEIRARYSGCSTMYTEEEKYYFENYKAEIRGLMSNYGIKSEEELFFKDDESAMVELKSILMKYKRILGEKEIGGYDRLSNNCMEMINSMVWISSKAYKMKSKAFTMRDMKNESNFVFNSKIIVKERNKETVDNRSIETLDNKDSRNRETIDNKDSRSREVLDSRNRETIDNKDSREVLVDSRETIDSKDSRDVLDRKCGESKNNLSMNSMSTDDSSSMDSMSEPRIKRKHVNVSNKNDDTLNFYVSKNFRNGKFKNNASITIAIDFEKYSNFIKKIRLKKSRNIQGSF